MRIESMSQFVPQLLLDEQFNLQEGSIVRGEILEQSTDKVLLRVNNNVVEAILEGVTEELQGKFFNFLVSSDSQGRIVLKLQNTEDQMSSKNTPDSSLHKLLNEMGVEKNEKTLEIVQNMMTFSIPIDKKNVQKMLNLQSKVEQLMNLKETDQVFVIKNPLEEIVEHLSQRQESISWKEELLFKDSILGKIIKLALHQGVSEVEIFQEMSVAKSVPEAFQRVHQLLQYSTTNDNMAFTAKEAAMYSINEFLMEIDGKTAESDSLLNVEKILLSEENITKNVEVKEKDSELDFSLNVEKILLSEENITKNVGVKGKASELNSSLNVEKILLSEENITKNVEMKGEDFEPNFSLNVEKILLSEENITKNVEVKEKSAEFVSQLNIENLFISEKNFTKDTKNMIDIRPSVQSFLENSPKFLKTDLSRIFSFFKKHDLPLTLGNFRAMLRYLEQPDQLLQVFQKLDYAFKKNPGVFSPLFHQTTETENMTRIQMPNLQDLFKSPEILNKMKELYPNDESWKENIQFIHDLNKDLNFMFFPLNSDFHMKGGFIHFLKQQRQRKVDYHKSLNIMINVETHHIGNVKVFCRANNKKMDIKLKIREEDVRLFESNIEFLKKTIEELGYEISPIKYIFDEKYSLLDLQMESKTSSYFLDLRV